MNLILVSGRFAAPARRHDADGELARALAAAGCTVRWIVPGPVEDRRRIDGVRVLPVVSPVPPFGAVQDRLEDAATERVLTVAIRAELPALVHILHYGGATSVNLGWVASRMGTSAVVDLPATPTLCHRGDLVHADGRACAQWDDPRRCLACCLTASNGSVSRLGSVIGRCLAAIRFPFNPFPTVADFLSRGELILGGLQVIDRILVRSPAEQEQLMSVGLRAEAFEVVAEPTAEALLALYRRVVD